mgnify:CR=1 FL=1|jgi:hypothetical protein
MEEKLKMKVIFLDIDGVLNSDAYKKKQLYNSSEGIESEIDPATLILLKKAVDTTGAKLVLSSSWRIMRKCNELEKFLMKFGISLSGKTPYVDGKRGLEIKQYLNENENIEQYLILDDEIFESFDEELVNHLILTKLDLNYHGFGEGLTDKHIKQIVETFGRVNKRERFNEER